MKRKCIKLLLALIGVAFTFTGTFTYAVDTNTTNNVIGSTVEESKVSENNIKIGDYNIDKEISNKLLVNNGANKLNNESIQIDNNISNKVSIINGLNNSESEAETEEENTDIGKAKAVDLNTITDGKITKSGENRWYLTYVPAGKITAYLGYTGSDMNLDLYLFKYDENEKKVTNVSYSLYGAGQAEQLSYVSEGGYYFIGVADTEGFSEDNQFKLALLYSEKYDEFEGNDNVLFSKEIDGVSPSTSKTISKTIDNDFDEDWYKIDLTEDKNSFISFTNSNSNVNYTMQIFNSDFANICTIKQNQNVTGLLPKGTYYVRVLSENGSDADNPYMISIIDKDKVNNLTSTSYIPNSINSVLSDQNDEKWSKVTVDKDQKVQFTFVNSDTSVKYAIDVYDANLNLLATMNQGQRISGEFKTGDYYLKLRSVSGYNSNAKATVYCAAFANFDDRQNITDKFTTLSGVLAHRDKWAELNLDSKKRVRVNLTRSDDKCNVEIYNADFQLIGIIDTQGKVFDNMLDSGKYYIRVVATKEITIDDKYSVSIDQYNSDELIAFSPDGKYTVSSNSDKTKAYINGVETSLFYMYTFDPGYTHYFVYNSTKTSKIKNIQIGEYKGNLCAFIYVTNMYTRESFYYNGKPSFKGERVVKEGVFIKGLGNSYSNAAVIEE